MSKVNKKKYREEVPKIFFKRYNSLDVEVMNFDVLSEKLSKPTEHNPYAPHRIEFYIILIVTGKSYTHFVDFKSYKLKKGSALFVDKSQIQHFTKELQAAEGFCIIFSSLFVEEYNVFNDNLKLLRLFNYHIETPIIHQEEMGQDGFILIAKQLYDEYNFPNAFAKSEMLRTLLHILLLKAERTKDVQASSDTKLHWLEIFSSFKNMLEKEYVITRNSRAYATKLLVSYKFLNDVVKKLTGKTVKAFIDEFVATEIKRYLVTSSLSIKEISYKTGFDESGNMVKFFKKNTSITPLKFRQQL